MYFRIRPRHVVVLVFVSILVAIGFGIYSSVAKFTVTPLASFGAPLRAGNRVYLLTGQWQRLFNVSRGPYRTSSSDLLVDIWAFDTSTAAPVYRRRLQKIRDGAMDGRSILGAHHQILWLLLPTGPHAVHLQTGSVVVDPERLIKLNPAFQGLLPTESHFFSFSAAGLAIKTADARTWYIHPDTFLATPAPPAGTTPGTRPTYFTPQATHAFLERGFALGHKWLGLLTPEEAVTMGRTHNVTRIEDETRRALYSADIKPFSTFFGPTPHYSNFQRLTEDFLNPGILAEHRPTGQNALVYRRDPDSVFVLHPDRLGENGRLHLARIAGPGGKVLWSSPLQLSVLQSLMPDEQSLLLYGRLYQKQDPNARVHTDPMHTAREMLVSVNWTTGAVHYHDQSDTAKHPEATAAQ